MKEKKIHPRVYLYKEGDECVDLTGGWSADGYSYDSSFTVSAGTKNETSMYFANGGSKKVSLLGTTNAIDFTKYSKLNVQLTCSSTANSIELFICPSKTNVANNGLVNYVSNSSALTNRILTMDISSVSQSGYVILGNANDTARTATVYNVWLE